VCEQGESLLAEYRGGVRIYSAAVEDLERMRVSEDIGARYRFWDEVEAKRLARNKARLNFQSHIKEHGC
jgi:hypothetical protein